MLLPVAAFVVAERRVATVRRLLTLRAPRTGVDVAALAALVAVVALLALAAAQPALSNTHSQRVRTDAEALFVLDISQSMAASAGPKAKTRLERASRGGEAPPRGRAVGAVRRRDAHRPRAARTCFRSPTRRRSTRRCGSSVAINQPPPREQNVRATTFGALAGDPGLRLLRGLGEASRDRPAHRRRDGARSTRTPSRGRSAATRGRTLLTVQLWRRNESIYGPSGRPDPNYRPDPASKQQLASLASATHGRVFAEGDLGSAAASLQTMLGSGPTKTEGRTRTTHPLAPYLAVLALVPLALIFRNQVRRTSVRGPGPGSGNHVPVKVPFMPPAAWPATVHL